MKWRVKNWRQFQHFKDRRPPWIKLYRDLLDDPDWHALKPEAAKALVMLWLIASEDDGNLPDPRKLAFRMRMTEKQVNQLLNSLTHWLEQVDIEVISPGYRDDAPETETYREEKETETEAPTAKIPKDELRRVLDADRTDAVIDHRQRLRKPLTVRAAALLAKQFEACPNPNVAADTMVLNGWIGFDPSWLKNKNGHDPPSTSGPPAGFREAKSTGEYIAYMREKTGDPKLENGDWRLSKWQHVPKDWTANVIAMKRGAG